jgi:hypothetical protein
VVIGDDASMRWALFAAGIVLVVLTWCSLVATFVMPRGRSIFQRASSSLVLRGVRAIVVVAARLTPSYPAKDSLLATVGPVALVVQLALFLAAFVVGAALQLLPWSVSTAAAFRQAAGSLFVVGLVAADGPTNNVIRVLAAATGAVTVALQIGYLPVIYQSFARRESLVALMESRAGVPAWGPEVLMRHQLVDSVDALPGLYRDWELWSADLAESHGTHPVLVLFRSPEVGDSWLLSLLAVLDAAALHLALCPSTAPSEARMCLRMGFSALRRVAATLGWSFDPDPSPLAPSELSRADFDAAVSQLRAGGFPVERDGDEAWSHFRGWRVNYESIAYAMADYLVAPHVPWSGPRHHLPPDVVLPARPPHRSPDRAAIGDDWLRHGR